MALAPAVDTLLRDLRSGSEVKNDAVTTLSDLDAEAAAAVREQWPSIPPARRAWVMEQAVERFLTSIDVDFSRLALVALSDSEARVRLAAVLALSESETRETADRLVQLTKTDPDDSVQEAAVDALGRFVLLTELGTFSHSGGERIQETLRGLVEDEAVAIEVRAAAVEALGPCTEPWVEPIIHDAYFSDLKDMRLAALAAMGRSADESWLELVIEQLHSDDAEFRIEAVNACGEIASTDALDELIGLFQDEDSDVVFAAISAVGAIGGPDAVAILDEFKLDADEDLHEAIDLAKQDASEVESRAGSADGDGEGEW
jgi:HEAT repeat protein